MSKFLTKQTPSYNYFNNNQDNNDNNPGNNNLGNG